MAVSTFNPKRFQRLLAQQPLLTTNHFIVSLLPSDNSSLVRNLFAHYSSNERDLINLSVGSVASPTLSMGTKETAILGHKYYTADGFSNSTLQLNNILNSGIQLQFFNALFAIEYSQKTGTYGYPIDYFIDIYVDDYDRAGNLKQEHRFQNCVLTNLQGINFNQSAQNEVQTFSATFNYFRYTPYL